MSTERRFDKKGDKPLTQRIDGVPRHAGPPCIHCNEPINLRRSRDGFMHDRCKQERSCSMEELEVFAASQGWLRIITEDDGQRAVLVEAA